MIQVQLMGSYGGDIEHALSAWTSTSRDLTDEKRERIPAMLKQLAMNGHETPFEKSALHFLVECDVATHIHIIKHRIAVSVNGESARYRELVERDYTPEDWPLHWMKALKDHTMKGQRLYHEALQSLVEQHGMTRKRAKESARYFLGYNNVTAMDVMFNFRSFIHFQRLRNDEHAQAEVRTVARRMLVLTRELGTFEYSLRAFNY